MREDTSQKHRMDLIFHCLCNFQRSPFYMCVQWYTFWMMNPFISSYEARIEIMRFSSNYGFRQILEIDFGNVELAQKFQSPNLCMKRYSAFYYNILFHLYSPNRLKIYKEAIKSKKYEFFYIFQVFQKISVRVQEKCYKKCM